MKEHEKYDFGKALREIRLSVGMSQEELAHKSDLDRTYISMLERSLKSPTLVTLVNLSKSLGISPVALMSASVQSGKENITNIQNKKEKYNPPFFGTSVSCGTPVGQDYFIEKMMSLDEAFIKNPSKTFFLKASGESMSPTIWPNDTLIIELNNKPKSNDIVLVQIEDHFTVKRFLRLGKSFRLVPDNPLFKEIEIADKDMVLICGVVNSIVRKF